jgi:hypothetical protein
MTKKDLLEAIEDMPMDALIKYLCTHVRDDFEEVTNVRYNKNDNIIDIW